MAHSQGTFEGGGVLLQATLEEFPAAGEDEVEDASATRQPGDPLTNGDECLICGREFESGHSTNATNHVLEEHRAEYEAFLEARNGNGHRPSEDGGEAEAELDPLGQDVEAAPVMVNPDGPVMMGEAPTERVGQAWGENLVDPRECDIQRSPECKGRMSVEYARVMAREEDGYLACPACLPRSQRYSNSPTYGDDHESHPDTILGSANARSHANDTAKERP